MYDRVRKGCNTAGPILGLLLAFTIFSIYTVAMKKAISDGSNPTVLAFLREILATSVLLPAAYYTERKRPADKRKFWPEQADVGHFILLGACMIWGAQLMSALALQHITATNYSLLAPSVPVITLAVALLTGYEYFNRRSMMSWMKVAAIFVTVFGAFYIAIAALMAAGPTVTSNGVYRNPLLGNILLMVNKVCVANYPILEKRFLKRYEPTVVVAWGYASGAVLTLMSVIPCALTPDAWVITPSGIGAIFYAGLLSSAFNYTLMCWVNKHTSPVMVMSFYPYQSICTPILAWLLTGTTISTNEVVGGVIIFIGLFCCVFARWKENAQRTDLGIHQRLEDGAEPDGTKQVELPIVDAGASLANGSLPAANDTGPTPFISPSENPVAFAPADSSPSINATNGSYSSAEWTAGNPSGGEHNFSWSDASTEPLPRQRQ